MAMPASVTDNGPPAGHYESSTTIRTGQNGKVLATISTNITNMTTTRSRLAGMAIPKVQNIFPERRDDMQQEPTLNASRISATLPSPPQIQERSSPLQFNLTGKVRWYQTMIPSQLPLLPTSTTTIPSASSPPKRQLDSTFSALDTIDHSSLTCFSELLSPNGGGSPTQEYDDLESDHIAYNLAFVDDYIAPPLSNDVYDSTECDIDIDPATDIQLHNIRCDACRISSDRALMPCQCCRYKLCEKCFGPCLANFKFPRIPKDGSGASSGTQQGGSQLKDVCERCIRSCAGPHKRPGCRLKDYVSLAYSPKPGTRRQNSSRQWSHKRQLTQLSITAINATNTNNTLQPWRVKFITFLWRVTTFTIHSFNLQRLFWSEADRLQITDSEDATRRRMIRTPNESSVTLVRHSRQARNCLLN
ncbi:hypothetical protein V1520DRAFT_392319 [Lipomyces starkeyi]|uniref:Uncharacterized protein n=1 Tax=Lipomyces starkeyi NRRL Y-11557 TaxID=675824 RepID=A0A1E3PUE8_LIPST|nr:hypothetical protein LIPSTDRAFT_114378 [Lipomyces starkeyi NRRL Y-11557]